MEQAPIPDTSETDIFRFLEERDIPSLVALGQAFFEESEFPTFSTFDPEAFEATMRRSLGCPTFQTVVFVPDGPVQGFLSFQLEAPYTKEPLALGFLFYVSPAYRKGPVGRILQEVAIISAKGCGAVAFYNGVMAGIDGVAKSMPNLYRKFGFEDLWWGRKIL